MNSRWTRRPLRPEPENGWVDWEVMLAPVKPGDPASAPDFRLDLAAGRLTREAPRRGSAAEAVEEPWVGTGLLVLDAAAALVGACPLRALHGGLRVVWSDEQPHGSAVGRLRDVLPEQTPWRGLRDATAEVGRWVRGQFSDHPSPSGTDELMIPWLPGLWRASELEVLGRWASSHGYDAVVPVVVDGTPRLLREFAERVELGEERTLRLFLREGDTSALAEDRAALAVGGVRWWFERLAEHPLPRMERIRRVSGALGLLGVLGSAQRSTGWVEGHRQAARRLEAERIDVRDLLAEDNLRLLEWLDQRVGETLVEWFEVDPDLSGEPPILRRVRAEIGIGATDRPSAAVRVADSRS